MTTKKRKKRRIRVAKLHELKKYAYKSLLIRDITDGPFLSGTSGIHLHLPARSVLPNIYHAHTEEVIYVLDGHMTGILEGEKRRLSAGTVIHIPRGAWHQFITHSSSCKAIALFHPALKVDRSADIHGEAGADLWD